MSDSHDHHVLTDLATAVRSTAGAPPNAADELEAYVGHAAATAPEARFIVEAAKEVLGGLMGAGPAAGEPGPQVSQLQALLARFDGVLRDDRLSGPARDAVLRAFDPVKDARDLALQRQPD